MKISIFVVALLLACGVARAAEITVIPLKDRDGIILVEGLLNFDDKEAFVAKIAPFSGGVVILKGPGGSAFAGIEIGKAIKMRGFTTWVESGTSCESACAIAWLGGARRLMGKAAAIGFHAVYKMERGAPVETGVGNAMYGAYLAQLGLPDSAIMYLSNAAPKEMNWLTPADAEAIGIKVAVFDPNSKPVSVSPSLPSPPVAVAPTIPQVGPSMVPQVPPATAYDAIDLRARDFVIALNVVISSPGDQYVRLVDGLYADQVLYFGKQLARSEVVAQLAKYVERWPDRSYVVRPETLRVQCDYQTYACRASGTLDFSAKSVTRNQWSRGAATFEYLLAFRPNQKYPVIVNEGGAVLNREMTSLQSGEPRYPQNFGAPGR